MQRYVITYRPDCRYRHVVVDDLTGDEIVYCLRLADARAEVARLERLPHPPIRPSDYSSFDLMIGLDGAVQ